MPKLINLSSIVNPENNKEIENAIQILSLKINIKTGYYYRNFNYIMNYIIMNYMNDTLKL